MLFIFCSGYCVGVSVVCLCICTIYLREFALRVSCVCLWIFVHCADLYPVGQDGNGDDL